MKYRRLEIKSLIIDTRSLLTLYPFIGTSLLSILIFSSTRTFSVIFFSLVISKNIDDSWYVLIGNCRTAPTIARTSLLITHASAALWRRSRPEPRNEYESSSPDRRECAKNVGRPPHRGCARTRAHAIFRSACAFPRARDLRVTARPRTNRESPCARIHAENPRRVYTYMYNIECFISSRVDFRSRHNSCSVLSSAWELRREKEIAEF